VYFEVLTKETQPTTSGGNLNGASGSADTTVGLYNTRGWMLNSPWSNAITTSWQNYYVPFGALIPRWMPAVGASMACPTGSTPKCQAPAFNPASVLGIQISMYRDPGFPSPSGSTAGTFDLWIDDVTLVKNDTGLPTLTGFPMDGTLMCTKPTGAAGKFLVTAYNNWKSTFVKNGTVIRPENGNDTVSEGIGYGMMIAVYMNDQALFQQLYAYWNAHLATGKLMTWCIPSGGGSCSASGGSATDADTDAAFALLMGSKKWNVASYKTDAMTLIGNIWDNEIDKTSHLPTGGSNYSNSTSSKVTNPSYFAPGMYKAFMANGDTHDWGSVITAVYGVINGSLGGSDGLFPAWCTNNCTAVGSNGGANDMIYQYDSHRIPWRIGSDYCWYGTASATTYLNKMATFFSGQGAPGVGKIADLYQLNGTTAGGAAPNSSSIIGTAAVGAMGSSVAAARTFVNDAYQMVLDQAIRGTLAPVDSTGKTPYSYFNATVGLLTLLTMTGNFKPL
jgi:endo-1,4-beta-D-glucanase Y